MRDASAPTLVIYVMSLYHSTKYKLTKFQRNVESLLDGDFPFEANKAALKALHQVFSVFEEQLDSAHDINDPTTLSSIARAINIGILKALPIIGFILRSTNVRNAFELLHPLQAIARAVLRGNPRLILSSEWDYLPFAYPQSFEYLPTFVLIGFPASEAASALLMPLAGHELGHAVWKNRGIGSSLQSTLQSNCRTHYSSKVSEFTDSIRNIEDAISESSVYAGFQAEELFSDMFAYAIFGSGYLRAFSYILAPGTGVSDAKYPTNQTRVNTIRRFATAEGIKLTEFRTLGFSPDARPGLPDHQLLISAAEAAVADITEELWSITLQIVSEASLIRPKPVRARHQLKNYRIGIPSQKTECIGDVIVAGWQRYDEIVRQKAAPKITLSKLDELNEIILKTLEVFEFRQRIA